MKHVWSNVVSHIAIECGEKGNESSISYIKKDAGLLV